jgi:peptide/nickel transport system permease protein
MTAYLARRALQAVGVVLLVTLIVFGLLNLAPGSALTGVLGPGAAHRSFLLAYLTWLGRVLQGNLGFSARLNVSVGTLLAASLPRTVVLTGVSTVIALAIAIPVGLLQAVRRGSVADHVLRGLTFLFYGMPAVVLGSVLVLFLAVDAHVFGAEGPQAAGVVGIITDVRDLTLPVCTLTLVTVAIFARYMRSSALDQGRR